MRLWISYVKNVKTNEGALNSFRRHDVRKVTQNLRNRACAKILQINPELKFHPPIIVYVDLKRKFGELETSSELILLFRGHIFTRPTAERMPKFDAAWTKKLKFFYLPTLIFC